MYVMYTCVRRCVCMRVWVCMCACVYVYVMYMHVNVCTGMYIPEGFQAVSGYIMYFKRSENHQNFAFVSIAANEIEIIHLLIIVVR